MACQTNNCWSSYTDLCSFVGMTCISIETVFSGLIENQFAVANSVAPVISDVAGFPTCTRVYFDTVAGTYTNSANANTIAIGIHLFGGRVALDGQGSCVTVQCTPAALPSAGALLNDDLCVTTNRGEAKFILLEDATASGCSFAASLPGDPNLFWNYREAGTGVGSIVPSNVVSSVTVGQVTVPYDGFYQINSNANTETPIIVAHPPGADTNFISNHVIIGGTGGTDINLSDMGVNLNQQFFGLMAVSDGICLSAGDIVYSVVAQSVLASSLRPSTIVSSNFSVIYTGPCA